MNGCLVVKKVLLLVSKIADTQISITIIILFILLPLMRSGYQYVEIKMVYNESTAYPSLSYTFYNP